MLRPGFFQSDARAEVRSNRKLSTFSTESIVLLRVAAVAASWLGCGSSPSLPPSPVPGLGEDPPPETLARTSSAGVWSICGADFTGGLPYGLDVLLSLSGLRSGWAKSQHDRTARYISNAATNIADAQHRFC